MMRSDGIASLYGSPEPSMISRDPDGIHQLDSYTSSVDPPEDRSAYDGGGGATFSLTMSSSSGLEPVDHEEEQQQQQMLSGKTAGMDIAKLVGAPPPPPTTMPPPKKKMTMNNNGSTVKTPRTTNGKNEKTGDEEEMVDVHQSGVIKMDSSDVRMTKSIDDGSIDEIEQTRSNIKPIQDLTAQTDTSASSNKKNLSPASTSPAKSIVEERMQKALSMYESDVLVLDTEESNIGGLVVNTAERKTGEQSDASPASAGPNGQSPVAINAEDTNQSPSGIRQLSPTPRARRETTVNPKAYSSSPEQQQVFPSPTSSEVTKPHSNQTLEEEGSVEKQQLVDSRISNATQSRMALGGGRSRRRAFSLERKQRRGASPNKKGGKKTTTRRGFFKKLFRGGTSRNGEDNAKDIDVESIESEEQREQKQQSAPADVVATNGTLSVAENPDDDNRQPPSPKADHVTHTFEPLEEEVEGGTLNEEIPDDAFPPMALPDDLIQPSMSHDDGDETKDTSPKSVPPSEVHAEAEVEVDMEIFVAPSSSKSTSGRKARKSFSQDPPDDEHGDPPMYTGRPLISPSAIQHDGSDEEDSSSQVYKSSKSHNHEPDSDGPSRTMAADPSPKHEHLGMEDPPPDSNHGPLATPAHSIQNLQVQVHGPAIDPVGASPIAKDRRTGNKSASLADPQGNSPRSLRLSQNLLVESSSTQPAETQHDSKSPTERAMALLDDEDKLEVKDVNIEIPDPTLEEGYQSEESEKEDNDEITPTSSQKSDLSTIEEKMKLTVDSAGIHEKPPQHVSATKLVKSALTKSLMLNNSPKGFANEKTESRKIGFKSIFSPNHGKHLSVSAAAFTNAQAVAYFHKLDGEESPRHSWHVSKSKKNVSVEEQKEKYSTRPRSSKKSKKKKKASSSSQKMASPSPAEYSAANFVLDEVAQQLELGKEADNGNANSSKVAPSRQLQHIPNDPNKMFAAYSRFKGRVPSRRGPEKPKSPVNSSPASEVERNPIDEAENFRKSLALVVPLGKITGHAVSRGVELRRQKREDDIARGLSNRVVLTPRSRPAGANRFKMIRGDESDIKDPIQRAGRRLLSKAAVPIQCAARRYLARQAALDRMWAVVQIQSVIRRWRCEANLQAHIHSATIIQAGCRGWLGRQDMKTQHSSAVKIQKIVRGYIAAVHTYDMIYFICQAQAMVRGALVRIRQDAKVKAAIDIQKHYRGHYVRKALDEIPKKYWHSHLVAAPSAVAIQSLWRSYRARVGFQMTVADVIMVQSIVRQWSARRVTILKRNAEHSRPVTTIQAAWRRHHGMCTYKKHLAAKKIQAQWRGFQSYSDYIFTIVDVLVVQRIARQWLAIRKVQSMKQDKAATAIQKTWRRQDAQKKFLVSIGQILIVQSVARRYFSKYRVAEQKEFEARNAVFKEERKAAATAIQKAWRGFWAYSHFIIVQYECTRIQALTRGVIARKKCNLQVGCAILIQATIRRHLAKKAVARMCVQDTLQLAQAKELRERNAAKRIQFWWRIVLDWMKEKKAALVIERFFIHVKNEVDREIVKHQLKMVASKERRDSRAMRGEDHLLERAWLKTVDENKSTHSSRRSKGSKSNSPSHNERPPPAYGFHRVPNNSRLQTSNHHEQRGIVSIASSSSFAAPPTSNIRLNPSEDFSEITTPSVLHRPPPHNQKSSNLKKDQFDDIFLEETFEKTFDETFEKSFEEVKPVRPKSTKNRLTTEDYIRKYGGGMKTAPNRLSKSASGGAFFSDGTHTTHVSTPQSSSTAESGIGSFRRRLSGGMSISVGPAESSRSIVAGSPKVPLTPRSSASPRKSRRSQSSPKTTVPANRRDISSHLPPITPTGNAKYHHQKPPIVSRGTIDTEIQSTMSGMSSYSRPSPRSRQFRHKNPVMVMRTYVEPEDGQSVAAEAHEMLLLGEEYGEV
mmetsp:Transcript_15201/g.37501  ORF Transcript_15201/g.37501 Transcript_15201/m.37501 type:complete len:1913 (+) Transcript_15201:313-6051(+)